MSETWTSLLAALVGAIVGGAASLAGTMLVNKQQMATNARIRMYDELLPRLGRAIADFDENRFSEAGDNAAKNVDETLAALERTGAIAGGQERRDATQLSYAWAAYHSAVKAFHEAPVPPPVIDENFPTIEEIGQDNQWKLLENLSQQQQYSLRIEIRKFAEALEAKLG